MSLAPSEQQALARIEQALRLSDPWLEARMATFAVLTSRRRIRRWTCVSPWRLRLKRIAGVTMAVVAAGLLALSLAFYSHPGHSSGGPNPGCRVTVTHSGGCPPRNHQLKDGPAAPGTP